MSEPILVIDDLTIRFHLKRGVAVAFGGFKHPPASFAGSWGISDSHD